VLKLDSKKITNSILDQLPRLDFCKLLVAAENSYDGNHIIPICRFSITTFFTSQRRIYKASGYSSDHIERIFRSFSYHEEAFMFTYMNQLYCDSFSSKSGTKDYGVVQEKLTKKIDDISGRITDINNVLGWVDKELKPIDIVNRCSNPFHSLPRGLPRRRKLHDVGNFDEVPSKKLESLIENHGSWDQYIATIKKELQVLVRDEKTYKRELELYNNKVSTVINEVLSAPFAILGC
jgi:hypothetical protein